MLGLFATREIMKKDMDHEVLKCVSEFLENTIDTLMVDDRIGTKLNPLFSIKLTREATWRCPTCNIVHSRHMTPVRSYTMAAYVGSEECPLDQCLLDLQTETQTGVTLLCGGEEGSFGGCGSSVTVERIVKPKIENLPSFLIIRNNSLMDRDLKKRMHVVYPEVLDLSEHTTTHELAKYHLTAVIFHHGHWSKHYSAHVCTDGKKWFNFNDEEVVELSNRINNGIVPETHKNYFSNSNIASKYKNKSGLRVSRGAFIWVYMRDEGQPPADKALTITPPPDDIVEYILQKQMDLQNSEIGLSEEWKKEKQRLLDELPINNPTEPYTLVSDQLLLSWFSSEVQKFVPQPSLLSNILCKHKKLNPHRGRMLKCVNSEKFLALLTEPPGIHIEDSNTLPVSLPPNKGFCQECILESSAHLLFIQKVSDLHKLAKKEAKKSQIGETSQISSTTLERWPAVALASYARVHDLFDHLESDLEDQGISNSSIGLDSTKEDEKPFDKDSNGDDNSVHTNGNSTNNEDNANDQNPQLDEQNNTSGVPDSSNNSGFSQINQDLVCSHNKQRPEATIHQLPVTIMQNIIDLCGEEAVHPATLEKDFGICPDCSRNYERAMKVCENGRQQKKQLSNLFLERKRPNPVKDYGKTVYILSQDFLLEWKSYIRCCERNDTSSVPPKNIDNSSLLCDHGNFLFPTANNDETVILHEEEWEILSSIYSADRIIVGQCKESGLIETVPGCCTEGCVQKRLREDYEDQFDYESSVIHIRQVHCAEDIPHSFRIPRVENNQLQGPRKRAKVSAFSSGNIRSNTANNKLVRASKTFSCNDTLREIQNFIGDRTGIWPMLQTIWLPPDEQNGNGEPRLMTEDHRGMTLRILRIKPDDTVYFKAAVEDMEKAAGDGITEFNEMEEI